MFLAETSIQLVPDGTLLLHLFVVGIMVIVLNRTLLKPINEILAEREKQVTGRRKDAETMATETQDKVRKYNEVLHDARAEGYRLLERERAEAVKEKDEKLRVYRDEMSREVAAQLQTTRKQQESVKGELESQAAAIGNQISSRILRRPTQ